MAGDMKRISRQEFQDLCFKVQMLSEKVDSMTCSSHVPAEKPSPPSRAPADYTGMIQAKDAAMYLGIPLSRLYYLAKYNQITYHRLKRKMLFDRDSLDSWKSTNKNQ